MSWRSKWLLRLLFLGVVACFAGSTGGCEDTSLCEAGESRFCACEGGVQSRQYCTGDTWDDCVCPGSQPAPQGASSGTGGDGSGLTPAQLYQAYCAPCHAEDGSGTSMGPDIREDGREEDLDELVEVMLEGEDDMPPIKITEAQALLIAEWMKANFQPGGGGAGGDDDDDGGHGGEGGDDDDDDD